MMAINDITRVATFVSVICLKVSIIVFNCNFHI